MKFDDLLNYRDELVRHARLANVAYAYQWLTDFSARVAHSGLQGEVVLRAADAEGNPQRASLTAVNFSQAVVQEHFLEAEIAELAAVLAFVHNGGVVVALRFRLEEVAARFLPALRRELEESEVFPEEPASSAEDAGRDADAA
jgi:hypothetical protein